MTHRVANCRIFEEWPGKDLLCERASRETPVAELIGVEILQGVGLNSIPTMVKPLHVLSDGEMERVRAAFHLSPVHNTDKVRILDSFCDKVDSTTAQSVAPA